MPLQRVGNGPEVGFGEHLLEVLVVTLDFRVLRVGQRCLEARVFHQFPGGQLDAPGLGQPFLVAVLVTQLLEEGALGRYIGGQAQGTVGQAVTRLRVATGCSPGQFVVGKIADQPGVVTVIAGGNGHGALGGHGKTRVERVGHAAPPVHAGADAGVIPHDR
ncbi:hypothetical protein D3C76_840650 [compost metagenome]